MVRSRALLVCLPDPSRNPRPYRAIWLLHRSGYEVWTLSPRPRQHVAAIAKALILRESPKLFVLQILQRLYVYCLGVLQAFALPKFFERLQWFAWGKDATDALAFIRRGFFDLVLVEDYQLLAGVLDARTRESGTRVLYDAREYATRELEASLVFRLLHQPLIRGRLQRCLHRVDAFYTVCQSLADEYHRDFGVKPVVIRSTPFYLSIRLQ